MATDASDIQQTTGCTESWWLMYCDLPKRLNWARLRVLVSGAAEVLDSDGITHQFASEVDAGRWLLEDEFIALASLDEDDAMELGIDLSRIAIPHGSTESEIRTRMAVAVSDA